MRRVFLTLNEALTCDWVCKDHWPLARWYWSTMIPYLQRDDYVIDSTAVAGGDELSFQVPEGDAVHLRSLRANKDLLVFSSQSNGRHSLLQLTCP